MWRALVSIGIASPMKYHLSKVYGHSNEYCSRARSVFQLEISSPKKDNRYQEISDKVDHCSNGYKARKESLIPKPDAAALRYRLCLKISAGKVE